MPLSCRGFRLRVDHRSGQSVDGFLKAATYPPGPAPTTTTSKRSVMSGGSLRSEDFGVVEDFQARPLDMGLQDGGRNRLVPLGDRVEQQTVFGDDDPTAAGAGDPDEFAAVVLRHVPQPNDGGGKGFDRA